MIRTRHLLALAAACIYSLATQAHAQASAPAAASAPGIQSPFPPCWPKQTGSTGSDYKRGVVAGVQWLGWTCQVNGQPRLYGYVWRRDYVLLEPEVLPSTPIATLRAYWAANVRDGDPSLNPARQTMRVAFGL